MQGQRNGTFHSSSKKHPARLAPSSTKRSSCMPKTGNTDDIRTRSIPGVHKSRVLKQKHSSKTTSFDTKTEVKFSKLLKQKIPGKNYQVDFDSRWEKFLELKNLDSARTRIYHVTFWSLWKARFSERKMRQLEQQTRDIEASLIQFNTSHHIPAKVSPQDMTSEELIKMAQRSVSSMNSSMRTLDEIRRGSSRSGSTAEQRVEQMMNRYRETKRRDGHTSQAAPTSEHQCRFCGSHGAMSVSKVIELSSDSDSDLISGRRTSRPAASREQKQTTMDDRTELSGIELLNPKSLLRPEFSDEISELVTGSPELSKAKRGVSRLEKAKVTEESSGTFEDPSPKPSDLERQAVSPVHKQAINRNGSTNSKSKSPARSLSTLEKRRKMWTTSVLASELSADACLNPQVSPSRFQNSQASMVSSDEKEIMQRHYETYKPVSVDFPYDMFNDVFSPNTARRNEYLSTSPLAHVFAEIA